jgi:hypothetical protein
MPLISTRGAASAQGFGEFAQSAAVNYIEDVFSTYLYTGNGSTQTITNGIDLSGKGGLVWGKDRGDTVTHQLVDTVRGGGKTLSSANTNAQGNNTSPYVLTFNTNGYESSLLNNENLHNFVSWTFRKQPKFFDVVTYTGTTGVQTVSHNLGAVPGCIIMKATSTTSEWIVNHRSLPIGESMTLNTTGPASVGSSFIENATSTTFQAPSYVNQSGVTYVAYLFAHDAGGFGLSGTDNVISCGSLVSTGGVVNVNLGYETQWLLIKNASNVDSWYMYDTMRGMSMTDDYFLKANNSNAEGNFGASYVKPTATGFSFDSSAFGASGETYIYIAIRRGPMKVPTTGTSVFSPNIWTGTGSTQQITTGFFPDMFIGINRGAVHAKTYATDILRGLAVSLATNVTDAENSESGNTFNMTGYSNNNGNLNSAFGGGQTYVGHFFRRAPGFFDVVCWTATSGINTITHNLGVAPELCIYKRRNGAAFWAVLYSAGSGTVLELNSTLEGGVIDPVTYFTSNGSTYTAPSATSLFLNTLTNTGTYVAYLFATVAGVSKVGSYTGNGSNQTINCGFTGGSRFVLIKRTDSTGDWYCWDSARGIVSGNDPHLSLNTTAAEVTTDDSVDTDSTGFIVNQLAATNINVSSASYIFLAVA